MKDARIVPSYEFDSLAGLGAVLCWLAVDCTLPPDRVARSRHCNIRKQHGPYCEEHNPDGWRRR